MPEYTPNRELIIPHESDAFDLEHLTYNFKKLDNDIRIVESGVATAYMSNGNNAVANYKLLDWYYKKYSDGTFEAYTAARVTGLPCNNFESASGVWFSKFMRFKFPSLGQKTLFKRSVTVGGMDDTAANGGGFWTADVSTPGDGAENPNYISVRVAAPKKETTSADKMLYAEIKGTWA